MRKGLTIACSNRSCQLYKLTFRRPYKLNTEVYSRIVPSYCSFHPLASNLVSADSDGLRDELRKRLDVVFQLKQMLFVRYAELAVIVRSVAIEPFELLVHSLHVHSCKGNDGTYFCFGPFDFQVLLLDFCLGLG